MKQELINGRSGGRILVDQLLAQGADTAYCVPGESYLAVLDALYDNRDQIRLINARHEAGAANMAEAYGKLTGRPGICLVTRGPGACQASVGVHTAFQDSTPMILLIGQVGRDMRDREAFQEIDYRKMFGPVAKWAAEIDQAARIPEYVARAYRVATSGRPGPVVLALPEDMLTDMAAVDDAPRAAPVQSRLAPGDVSAIRRLVEGAERPMVIVGGGGWTDAAARDFTTFAERNGLPVACSFRRQDIVGTSSSSFIGDFGTAGPLTLVKRIAEADLLLVLGARLGEMTTKGYTALDVPNTRPRLVHIHAGAEEVGRVYQPELGLCAGPEQVAAALADEVWVDGARWADWRGTLRAEFLADIRPEAEDGPLSLAQAYCDLAPHLDADAIVTLDAGNHTGWPQRYLHYGRPSRQLGSTAGAMGYSVPSAVAAAILHPDRLVIGFVGDGGFQMCGFELATAIQHGARPIIIVTDNQSYGTIRMHQERDYPARVSGTDLVNPDFAAMGAAMGAHVERVAQTADFVPAFARARASGKAALICLAADPERVSTRTTVAKLRARS